MKQRIGLSRPATPDYLYRILQEKEKTRKSFTVVSPQNWIPYLAVHRRKKQEYRQFQLHKKKKNANLPNIYTSRNKNN
jgi:hypothetical protein